MTKFLHMIPCDGIGGVESAARSMALGKDRDIVFDIDFLFKDPTARGNFLAKLNPIPFLSAGWRGSRRDVDLLIVSLWLCAIVGLIAKLLRPSVQLVVFLHSSRDGNLIDRFATRAAVYCATEIWADSEATLANRIRNIPRDKCRVISFVTRRFDVLPRKVVGPSFVFWGRFSAPKALDRAIGIFESIHKVIPAARFLVIGPDEGELDKLKELRELLDLTNSVTFAGSATHDEIVEFVRLSEASFYLQTSIYEGMAMSVVESMQLGLVPVVTPAGEIANYCKNGINSVIIESDRTAIAEVIDLLDNNERYQSLRHNAIATWAGHPLYRDSVLSACTKALRADAT